MDRRFAAPGGEISHLVAQTPEPNKAIFTDQIAKGAAWDQYLARPQAGRIGISCSGGGIRSASYSLGALQELRHQGVLGVAEHLACVSGGGYISIAHTLLASESLRQPSTSPGLETELFGELPPWAPLSPEERHLRDHSNYLAPGFKGKLWFAINIVYGMLRHLVPFACALTLIGAGFGVSIGRWVGPALRDRSVAISYTNILLLIAALGVLAGAVLIARQFAQKSKCPNPRTLTFLQTAVMRLFALQAAIAALLVAVPALLVWLSHELSRDARPVATGIASGGGVVLGAIAAFLRRRESTGLRRRIVRLAIPVLTMLAGPLTLFIPFLAVTYVYAKHGNHLTAVHVVVASIALGLFLVSWWLNEATPNMHLLYRERLSTAFAGMRSAEGLPWTQGFAQPPWKRALSFSEIVQGSGAAKLPNLVICAALNVAGDDVPPGRLAGSFTFEKTYSGSPLTGYVSTRRLEELAGEGVLTMPAMMAIAGAAISPSMGKMTRPALRLLMALFNVRLGVWLPNPLLNESVGPHQAHTIAEPTTTPQPGKGLRARLARSRRAPGTGYAFRELFGLNDLRAKFVYVSDGGHWENLGVVELLRRGCTQIVCFDAAGDDIDRFWTISEAIGLARTELGVEIEIDLDPLTPDSAGVSPSDHATGTITYPDGTSGVLVFAKAAMAADAPQDCKAYRQRNPKFPADPTSDQLFNDLKFESYRALGAHAAHGAVAALNHWRFQNNFTVLTP
jgi:hypothetical protein